MGETRGEVVRLNNLELGWSN